MAEDLQGLLERIRQDGVDKADAEAKDIISTAQRRAQSIVDEAEAKAKALVEQAEKDAQAFEAHGVTSLEQAARNVLLSLGEAIQQTLVRVVALDTRGAMGPDALGAMIAKVVDGYLAGLPDESRLDVLLSESDREKLGGDVLSHFAAKLKAGSEIKADGSVLSGFRVSLVDQQLEHDFSAEAITEALCGLLRPRLAEIVRVSGTAAADDGEA